MTAKHRLFALLAGLLFAGMVPGLAFANPPAHSTNTRIPDLRTGAERRAGGPDLSQPASRAR